MVKIITNNPKVKSEYSSQFEVEFYPDKTQMEILFKVRDYIHLGAKLLTHPMMGRVRPHETPYESILIDIIKGELDLKSLYIIEESLSATKGDLEHAAYIKYDDGLLDDLKLMDLLLLRGGIEERENR